MKDDLVYVRHILDAILKIEKYLRDVPYEDFFNNDMIVDAVVRELEILGEAARNVSINFKINNFGIPWNKMISMRNYLIHEYFGVNRKIVWETCQIDIVELKLKIFLLLENK